MTRIMEAELAPFVLSTDQLQQARRELFNAISRGLERDGEEIKALPAHQAPPADLEGRALVVDTGGTNMRAAIVELEGRGKARIVQGPIKEKLEARGEHGPLTGRAFFEQQAALAKRLDPERGLPVGYCFSYPSEILPDRDGRLIAWTKSVDIPEVVGQKVGSALGRALADQGLAPKHVRVLNDTVASLLGGAFHHKEIASHRFVGLIVGTGTNMAGFFSTKQAPKLVKLGLQTTAVNLESGNFTPPFLTRFDDALDAESDNPGKQRFEKAISGYYLPFLFARVLPDQPGFDPKLGSKALVEYRDSSIEAKPLEVAEALLGRSADLTAAALAAMGDFYGDEAFGVVAEGSLFWNDPKFAPRTSTTLATLLGDKTRAKIVRLEDSNLIGSACAAISP